MKIDKEENALQALADLWSKPLIRCNSKGVMCQFAVKGDDGKWSKCHLGKCVKYSRERRRYESNARRPR